LPVPKINAIIFVVDEKDYSITYHIFRMDTEKDIEIHAPSSVFGRTIGFPNSQDTVEKISDGILVLGNVDNNARSTLQSLSNLCTVKSLYYLDLNKRTVAASKTLYLDKEGKLILERDDP